MRLVKQLEFLTDSFDGGSSQVFSALYAARTSGAVVQKSVLKSSLKVILEQLVCKFGNILK